MRMWRHGIYSFLELLRRRLPASRGDIVAFIYLAYSIITLLYEPAFEDTWVECLEYLGCYRMAVEDNNPEDKDIRTGVARDWYSKAFNKNPTTSRDQILCSSSITTPYLSVWLCYLHQHGSQS